MSGKELYQHKRVIYHWKGLKYHQLLEIYHLKMPTYRQIDTNRQK